LFGNKILGEKSNFFLDLFKKIGDNICKLTWFSNLEASLPAGRQGGNNE